MKVYFEKPILTQHIVMEMIEAACKQASELGACVNVAIMDDGGNLKGFVRMDGAPLLSMEIAQNKAYSAAAFGISTSDWFPRIQHDPSLVHGLVQTNRLTIFGGGLPIYIGKHLVGGIGVSGGTTEEDVICAEKAISILNQRLNDE